MAKFSLKVWNNQETKSYLMRPAGVVSGQRFGSKVMPIDSTRSNKGNGGDAYEVPAGVYKVFGQVDSGDEFWRTAALMRHVNKGDEVFYLRVREDNTGVEASRDEWLNAIDALGETPEAIEKYNAAEKRKRVIEKAADLRRAGFYPNKYPGVCHQTGATVAVGEGFIRKESGVGDKPAERWITYSVDVALEIAEER